ncbi:MAG: hypothetical protein ACFFFH_20370 [Candidatus Thorarchaeota archaeon]
MACITGAIRAPAITVKVAEARITPKIPFFDFVPLSSFSGNVKY